MNCAKGAIQVCRKHLWRRESWQCAEIGCQEGCGEGGQSYADVSKFNM